VEYAACRECRALVAFHRTVNHIDRIGAKHRIRNRAGVRSSLDLVLPHEVDELPLIGSRQLREIAPEHLVAAPSTVVIAAR